MPRKVEDIIVPERKRSIRNIPIPENRKRHSVSGAPSTPSVGKEEPYNPVPPRRLERPRRGFRKRIWLSSGVGALILIFAALSLWNGATLSYVPRSTALAFNNEVYTARKTSENGLLYSVVKLSGEKSDVVPAEGEQSVERKASGTIVVYNNATVESQRLIENTRFESPEGKIYRIAKAISIPGKTGSNPGALEVIVYADEAGESYNTGLTDFTVPGLKGTARYSTIYARSKTPITGGFVGQEKVVSPADTLKVKTELQTLLSKELLAKAALEVPDDFILFPALSSVIFEDLVQTTTSNANSAAVNLKANLYGIMFKKSDLGKELSKNKATIGETDRVELESFDSLNISFAGAAPTDLVSATQINFKVSGNTKLFWLTDEVALKSDLAGRPKREISAILKNYPTIFSADATVRPFWKTSFPDNAQKISIKKLKVE